MQAPVTRDEVFALLAIARFGACATAPDGTFVFWNHRAERILGLSAAEVIGRRRDEVIAPAAPHKASPGPASNGPPMPGPTVGRAPDPFTASMMCASGGHKQVALTPVVVADQPGGDALMLYLFDDPPESGPPAPADRQASELPHTPQPEPAPNPAAHQPSAPGPGGLSRREIQVLRLVAVGSATSQIASDLQISVHTVRNHVRSLRHKLNAKTKLDAVVTAIHQGLI